MFRENISCPEESLTSDYIVLFFLHVPFKHNVAKLNHPFICFISKISLVFILTILFKTIAI